MHKRSRYNEVFIFIDTFQVKEQGNHYQCISNTSKQVSPKADLAHFIKTLNVDKASNALKLHQFLPPSLKNDNTLTSGVCYIISL